MNKARFIPWRITVISVSMALACNALSRPAIENATPAVSEEIEATAMPTGGVTSVRLTLVTGDDGTADNPVFELLDSSMTPIFTITLDNPGDLQSGQTDVYEFSVPHPFCQITTWQMTKPSSSAADDPWLPTEIYLELDGKMVFFYRLFSDLGPITADSPRDGNWSATDLFTEQCGD
jgi:hypothetical protein